jgi:hypothetical protein
VIAVLGGNFLEPNPFTYFFGTGIGTNLGASIVWGFLAGLLGMFVARKVKAAWARLHAKIDAHHDELHSRLDAHEEMHRAHAEKLDRLLAAQGGEHIKPQID